MGDMIVNGKSAGKQGAADGASVASKLALQREAIEGRFASLSKEATEIVKTTPEILANKKMALELKRDEAIAAAKKAAEEARNGAEADTAMLLQQEKQANKARTEKREQDHSANVTKLNQDHVANQAKLSQAKDSLVQHATVSIDEAKKCGIPGVADQVVPAREQEIAKANADFEAAIKTATEGCQAALTKESEEYNAAKLKERKDHAEEMARLDATREDALRTIETKRVSDLKAVDDNYTNDMRGWVAEGSQLNAEQVASLKQIEEEKAGLAKEAVELLKAPQVQEAPAEEAAGACGQGGGAVPVPTVGAVLASVLPTEKVSELWNKYKNYVFAAAAAGTVAVGGYLMGQKSVSPIQVNLVQPKPAVVVKTAEPAPVPVAPAVATPAPVVVVPVADVGPSTRPTQISLAVAPIPSTVAAAPVVAVDVSSQTAVPAVPAEAAVVSTKTVNVPDVAPVKPKALVVRLVVRETKLQKETRMKMSRVSKSTKTAYMSSWFKMREELKNITDQTVRNKVGAVLASVRNEYPFATKEQMSLIAKIEIVVLALREGKTLDDKALATVFGLVGDAEVSGKGFEDKKLEAVLKDLLAMLNPVQAQKVDMQQHVKGEIARIDKENAAKGAGVKAPAGKTQ